MVITKKALVDIWLYAWGHYTNLCLGVLIVLSIGCGVAYCIAIIMWLEQGNSTGGASCDLQFADTVMLFPGIGALASFVDAFDLCMLILLVVHHHVASLCAGGSGNIAYMGPMLVGQVMFALATQSGQFASGCKANSLATHIRALDADYSRYYELSYGLLRGQSAYAYRRFVPGVVGRRVPGWLEGLCSSSSRSGCVPGFLVLILAA